MKFVTENIFLIVIAFVSGGMLLWPLVNRSLAGATVNTLQATRLINDGAVVLDVRDAAEYGAGHLANSRNIPTAELDKRVAELPANKPVVVVCASGSRAARAAAALRRAGRTDVFCLDGGLAGWRQAGLPVVKKA
ncbi:MAG: rhodanese-like domain-containing protein [Burkholderiaceae bacterium]|nr:rhodanese-like domain-containing protein [Burkholderiales bacterium]MCZ8336872.1 rhodanese-like domain-containing protein [Burkholderiaceae bacterium]